MVNEPDLESPPRWLGITIILSVLFWCVLAIIVF